MAKKKADAEAAAAPETPKSSNGGSVAGYFRPIFRAKPALLKERSNEELYQRWLKDHPGETVVPENVKQGLSNLKSVLRKKLGAKRGPKPKAEQPAQQAVLVVAVKALRPATARLEQLEQSIDDSLALAKQIDRVGLHDVIRLLRAARNRVVIQMVGD